VLDQELASYHYIVYIGLMMVGLYTIIAKPNLIKKVIGLGVLQTGVFLLFISAAAVEGGAPPIHDPAITLYANPLPHVLILTAIVVSVSTTAVALALCIRISAEYGSIEEDELIAEERK
jgi:multicomponent Na+:H+ antiporter subunit C